MAYSYKQMDEISTNAKRNGDPIAHEQPFIRELLGALVGKWDAIQEAREGVKDQKKQLEKEAQERQEAEEEARQALEEVEYELRGRKVKRLWDRQQWQKARQDFFPAPLSELDTSTRLSSGLEVVAGALKRYKDEVDPEGQLLKSVENAHKQLEKEAKDAEQVEQKTATIQATLRDLRDDWHDALRNLTYGLQGYLGHTQQKHLLGQILLHRDAAWNAHNKKGSQKKSAPENKPQANPTKETPSEEPQE